MAKSSNGLNTTTNISSGSSNKIKNGGNGTIVGNLIRKITGAPAPSKPMVFTVGAGMTAPQTAAAYNKISGTSVNKITAPSKKPVLTANAPLPGVPGGLMQPRVNNTALQGLNLSMPGSKQSTTPNSGNVSLGPIQPEWQGPIQQTNGGGGSWGGSIARNTVSNTGSRSGTSYSGTSTGGGSAGTGTGSLAAPNGAATIGNEDFNYSKTPQQIAEEEALRRVKDYNDSQANTDTNYENIMRDTLRQFQGEIDATNQVYADKLRIAGIQGQSRLGQTRAENFNSGAVNSSFGNAAQDRTQSYNNDIEAGIQAQKLQSLAQIENSARELGNKYYEQKKAAKESGLAGYLENIKSAGTQKEAIATDIATNMINSGLTVDEISPAKLELIAKNAGVPLQQIKTTFKALKDAKEKEAAEAALKGQFDLSEGQARYDAKGNMIASRAKTYAPKSGGSDGGSGSVIGSSGSPVSSAAQNILNQLNTNGGTVDDYVKGSSKDAQRLRNEVYDALNNQGGRTNIATGLLTDAKDVVKDLINTKSYKDLGGYSTKLGGQFGTSYGDAKARVAQLSALLARDNLGLLKGAMSDKDLAFIQAMSTGFEGQGVQSEDYIEDKLNTIYTKLDKKVGGTNNTTSNNSNISTGSSAQSTEEDEALLSEFDL